MSRGKARKRGGEKQTRVVQQDAMRKAGTRKANKENDIYIPYISGRVERTLADREGRGRSEKAEELQKCRNFLQEIQKGEREWGGGTHP